jgi:hypothetical protein
MVSIAILHIANYTPFGGDTVKHLTEQRNLRACRRCPSGSKGKCPVVPCKSLTAAIYRLYAYEETGFTPYGVLRMKEIVTQAAELHPVNYAVGW